jgi:hypothetical protein
MIWASNEALATVIENGTESLVEYAASQGTTPAEAEKFARTAVWAVESVMTDAAMLADQGETERIMVYMVNCDSYGRSSKKEQDFRAKLLQIR